MKTTLNQQSAISAKGLNLSTLFDINSGIFSRTSGFTSQKNFFMQFKNKFKNNLALFLPLIIFAGLIVFAMVSYFSRSSTASLNSQQDERVTVKKPIATQSLKKKLTLNVEDVNGQKVKVSYEIDTVEVRDQIIVKGQVANSVTGRLFLILNVKITNDSSSLVKLSARDFVRVIVDDSEEKLAADIHNDPVNIQPIATKYTRLGLPINDSYKNIKLQVGEISGKKETIELSLR